jgi:hypothetical protein
VRHGFKGNSREPVSRPARTASRECPKSVSQSPSTDTCSVVFERVSEYDRRCRCMGPRHGFLGNPRTQSGARRLTGSENVPNPCLSPLVETPGESYSRRVSEYDSRCLHMGPRHGFLGNPRTQSGARRLTGSENVPNPCLSPLVETLGWSYSTWSLRRIRPTDSRQGKRNESHGFRANSRSLCPAQPPRMREIHVSRLRFPRRESEWVVFSRIPEKTQPTDSTHGPHFECRSAAEALKMGA